MVFRKPYAFLIKHFKLIHIILTGLMILFFVKMHNIASFLSSYVSEQLYGRVSGVVSEYAGFFVFLLPILIMVILGVVIYLLRLKGKPTKYYWITMLVYVIEFIILIVAFVELSSIQQGTASSSLTKILKDLINAMSYIPLPFMLVALVRGIGFNVKQFNFQKDLVELNVTDEDSEEFEVSVEFDTENLKVKLNRKLRFIKYVYLENKPVFFVVFGISIIAIIFGIYSFISSIEHIYSEKESFSAYGSTITVNNSYMTEYGIDGTLIKNTKFYIIVDLNIKNNYDTELNIPYNYIYIRLSEYEKVSPIDTYKDEFADFGLRYTSSDTLNAQEERQVVLVFEVDNTYKDNDFRLEYLASRNSDSSETGYNYIKVDLDTQKLDEKEEVITKSIGEEMDFKDSLISGTKITIEEVDFNKRYSYKYTQVINGVTKEYTKALIPTDTASYKKTVMRLKVNLTKSDSLYSRIYSSFYENFASIQYEVDGKVTTQKASIIDLTPSGNEYTYLEVVEDVSTADKVYLIFTIRDKEYKYILVDNTKEDS